MSKELISLCKMRNLQLLHTYRPFLQNNKPIRSYFAVKDKGLHLNLEGSRGLRFLFSMNASLFPQNCCLVFFLSVSG